MGRKSIAFLGVSLLAALALVAAGCGGGKKSAATTEAATTEAVTTTEAATTEATTTEAATTEATTTAATTSAFSGLASSKNCRDLATLGQKFSSAFTGGANGKDLKNEAQLLKEFADKTPSDIRPDFQVVANYLSKIADAAGNLKAGQTPDAATIAKLQKLSTEINQAKLTQASQHISAWVTKNCHA